MTTNDQKPQTMAEQVHDLVLSILDLQEAQKQPTLMAGDLLEMLDAMIGEIPSIAKGESIVESTGWGIIEGSTWDRCGVKHEVWRMEFTDGSVIEAAGHDNGWAIDLVWDTREGEDR